MQFTIYSYPPMEQRISVAIDVRGLQNIQIAIVMPLPEESQITCSIAGSIKRNKRSRSMNR